MPFASSANSTTGAFTTSARRPLLGGAQRLLDVQALGHVHVLEHQHLAPVEIAARAAERRDAGRTLARAHPALEPRQPLGARTRRRTAARSAATPRGVQLLERQPGEPVARRVREPVGGGVGEHDLPRAGSTITIALPLRSNSMR
jgi:hypothetical protein